MGREGGTVRALTCRYGHCFRKHRPVVMKILQCGILAGSSLCHRGQLAATQSPMRNWRHTATFCGSWMYLQSAPLREGRRGVGPDERWGPVWVGKLVRGVLQGMEGTGVAGHRGVPNTEKKTLQCA